MRSSINPSMDDDSFDSSQEELTSEERELRDHCTFRPRTNPTPTSSFRSRHHTRRPIHERYEMERSKREMRMSVLREDSERKHRDSHPFRPRVRNDSVNLLPENRESFFSHSRAAGRLGFISRRDRSRAKARVRRRVEQRCPPFEPDVPPPDPYYRPQTAPTAPSVPKPSPTPTFRPSRPRVPFFENRDNFIPKRFSQQQQRLRRRRRRRSGSGSTPPPSVGVSYESSVPAGRSRDDDDLSACTFRPSLCFTSQVLVAERRLREMENAQREREREGEREGEGEGRGEEEKEEPRPNTTPTVFSRLYSLALKQQQQQSEEEENEEEAPPTPTTTSGGVVPTDRLYLDSRLQAIRRHSRQQSHAKRLATQAAVKTSQSSESWLLKRKRRMSQWWHLGRMWHQKQKKESESEEERQRANDDDDDNEEEEGEEGEQNRLSDVMDDVRVDRGEIELVIEKEAWIWIWGRIIGLEEDEVPGHILRRECSQIWDELIKDSQQRSPNSKIGLTEAEFTSAVLDYPRCRDLKRKRLIDIRREEKEESERLLRLENKKRRRQRQLRKQIEQHSDCSNSTATTTTTTTSSLPSFVGGKPTPVSPKPIHMKLYDEYNMILEKRASKKRQAAKLAAEAHRKQCPFRPKTNQQQQRRRRRRRKNRTPRRRASSAVGIRGSRQLSSGVEGNRFEYLHQLAERPEKSAKQMARERDIKKKSASPNFVTHRRDFRQIPSFDEYKQNQRQVRLERRKRNRRKRTQEPEQQEEEAGGEGEVRGLHAHLLRQMKAHQRRSEQKSFFDREHDARMTRFKNRPTKMKPFQFDHRERAKKQKYASGVSSSSALPPPTAAPVQQSSSSIVAGPPVLRLEITIRETNETGYVDVRVGDDPRDLARKFAGTYDLPEAKEVKIEKIIRRNMELHEIVFDLPESQEERDGVEALDLFMMGMSPIRRSVPFRGGGGYAGNETTRNLLLKTRQ